MHYNLHVMRHMPFMMDHFKQADAHGIINEWCQQVPTTLSPFLFGWWWLARRIIMNPRFGKISSGIYSVAWVIMCLYAIGAVFIIFVVLILAVMDFFFEL